MGVGFFPGLAEIGQMELGTGAEGVPAAKWIHLFAITVGPEPSAVSKIDVDSGLDEAKPSVWGEAREFTSPHS